MHVRFEQTVLIEGTTYMAGQVVDTAEIDRGCLESCLRLQRCVECEPPARPRSRSAKTDQAEE